MVLTNLQAQDDQTKHFVSEMMWIIVNLSADDDPQVVQEMLVPHYNLLGLVNQCLLIYGQGDTFDDNIVRNILWVFGNMIADTSAQVYEILMNATDLHDFLVGVVGWPTGMPSSIMMILPWLMNSIT